MKFNTLLLFLLVSVSVPVGAYVDYEAFSLTNEDRKIVSIGVKDKRVCWIDTAYKLHCLGDNRKSQSLTPMSVGKYKKIYFSSDKELTYACAVEEKDNVTKCWKRIAGVYPDNKSLFPFVVNGLVNPKEFYIGSDSESMSCAVQEDKVTKCWLNTPKVIGFISNLDFLSTFDHKNTKFFAKSSYLACAVSETNKVTCWTDEEVVLEWEQTYLKDIEKLILTDDVICVVGSTVRCRNIKDTSYIDNKSFGKEVHFESLDQITLDSNSNNYHEKLEIDIELPKSYKFKSVLVESDMTCGLTLKNEALCWGKLFYKRGNGYFAVDYNNLIAAANEEQKLILEKKAKNNSYYINKKTENCYAEYNTIFCDRSDKRNDRYDKYIDNFFTFYFKERPFYIYETNGKICGVSNSEYKCSPINWGKVPNAEVPYKATRKSHKILIDGVEYKCTEDNYWNRLKCGDSSQMARDDLIEDFYINVEWSKNELDEYSYFEYDREADFICGYMTNNDVKKSCMKLSKFKEVSINVPKNNYLMNSNHLTCGITLEFGEAQAFCNKEDDKFNSDAYVGRVFNVKKPWFIHSYPGGVDSFMRRRFSNVCLSADSGLYCGTDGFFKVLEHQEEMFDYYDHSLSQPALNLKKEVVSIQKDLTIYYSRVMGVLNESIIVDMENSNYLLRPNYVRDHFQIKVKMGEFVGELLKFVLSEVQSEKIQEEILPTFALDKTRLNTSLMLDVPLSKDSILSITQLKINLQLELLSLYDEFFKVNSQEIEIYKNQVNLVLENYSKNKDYSEFLNSINSLFFELDLESTSDFTTESSILVHLITVIVERLNTLSVN